MSSIDDVTKGDRITADTINEVIDEVNRLGQIRVGSGLGLYNGIGGVKLWVENDGSAMTPLVISGPASRAGVYNATTGTVKTSLTVATTTTAFILTDIASATSNSVYAVNTTELGKSVTVSPQWDVTVTPAIYLGKLIGKDGIKPIYVFSAWSVPHVSTPTVSGAFTVGGLVSTGTCWTQSSQVVTYTLGAITSVASATTNTIVCTTTTCS